MEQKILKGTVVFACGLNPHPVSKIEGIRSIRAGRVFMPAIFGKARYPNELREYDIDFPISVSDMDSQEKLEAVRAMYHKQLDNVFDAFIQKWEEVAKTIEEQGKPKTVREALKKVPDLTEEPKTAPEPTQEAVEPL
jgi:hypothetical protein